MNKKIIIQKFGGSVLYSLDAFEQVGKIIQTRQKEGYHPCVVVSALGKTTDQLLSYSRHLTHQPELRELDVLLSIGETASSALLSIYINSMGIKAQSFSSQQSGIVTNSNFTQAEILSVHPDKMILIIEQEIIPIVAGFQGYDGAGNITTLGRGGSDLTAVVLGQALKAEAIEFYKDVGGIYEHDPHFNQDAKILPFLDYNQALSVILQEKHEIIYPPAIEYAKQHHLLLRIYSFAHDCKEPGTTIFSEVN